MIREAELNETTELRVVVAVWEKFNAGAEHADNEGFIQCKAGRCRDISHMQDQCWWRMNAKVFGCCCCCVANRALHFDSYTSWSEGRRDFTTAPEVKATVTVGNVQLEA
jgi:hypothetical protein